MTLPCFLSSLGGTVFLDWEAATCFSLQLENRTCVSVFLERRCLSGAGVGWGGVG